ncbi:MAG TPA: GcrA family cell cycle regulator [Acetobacteraceae bacterium]|jgi:GcrA cell cycle regulator
MEWADETIVRLRELWSEGHSTAEIGRRLGVSKNAVVGKAHRLDLPARPSPIRREGERPPSRPCPPRRFTGPSLPPLSSTSVSSMALGSAGLTPAQPAAQLPPRPPVIIAPRPAPLPRVAQPPASPPPRPYGRVITCCWPIGEPGTRSFRFCDGASVPGKPYCLEHAQLAYVKVRDRREDAA